MLTGCVEHARDLRVAGYFSASSGCPVEQIKVQPEPDGVVAKGCGKSAHYDCYADGCQAVEGVAPTDFANTAPKARANKRRRVTELNVMIVLGDGDRLFVAATPQENEEAQVLLDSYVRRDCQLDLMVDGQLLELREGSTKSSRALPRDVVLDLASAQQVGVRACDRRWSLAVEDISKLHRFARRYAEELAWQGTPRKGRSGGRRPPLGGWQPWHALDAFPTAAPTEAALSGTQLFEKLAPSVWRVEGKLEGGISQGSAIAVTNNRLVTNCHVVEGALKIIVRQGKAELVAKLQASEPAKDRCVLEVAETQLKPVTGVRPYVDLKVGEPLYTLGAPSGLDLTLADGILSGLREDEGVRFVQTTAPISPGSSGGGLFDARGNLVGITTLAFVGKQHLNQSLNFAIAAEMYWSP